MAFMDAAFSRLFNFDFNQIYRHSKLSSRGAAEQKTGLLKMKGLVSPNVGVSFLKQRSKAERVS